MAGKTMILSVLVLSLFMAQVQVDASLGALPKSCCPSSSARNIYNICRLGSVSKSICAATSGCQLINSVTCPSGYTYDILETTGNAADEYCKLGCVSSVCGALTTLQNSDASEIVNGAVNKCVNACSTVCTKSSMNAVKSA